MSDVDNDDIMLGSYSRDDDRNEQSESELNLDSGSVRPQQSSNLIGEDFRSLLNTNSWENSEMTIETTMMISKEISDQMSRKLNESRKSLSYQIHGVITSAITNIVVPSIQNTLCKQGRVIYTGVDPGSSGPHEGTKTVIFTTADQGSSGLQRNLEVENGHRKHAKIAPRHGLHRNSSVDAYTSEHQCLVELKPMTLISTMFVNRLNFEIPFVLFSPLSISNII